MILGGSGPDGSTRIYLATARIPGSAPDFHIAGKYPKPAFKKT
jgi:hypothetical protein